MEQGLRVTPGKSLVLFVCWWVLTAVIAVVLIDLVGTATLSRIRWAIVIQNIFVFMAPVVLTMFLVAVRPWRFIGVDTGVSRRMILMLLLVALVSIPAMNNLVAWNEAISLPDSWSGFEEILRDYEASARASVESIMGGTSVADLLIGVLLMGCLTGLAEEMFFRGGLQPLLCAVLRNRHAAVWATAFIFSAVHLQFFGFFPRLLMGAFFGYLVMWTGSLWASVFAHALNNSLVVAAFWLTNRGVMTFDVNRIAVGGSATDWIVGAVSLAATVLAVRYCYTTARFTPRNVK